jgi:hypothetical protein
MDETKETSLKHLWKAVVAVCVAVGAFTSAHLLLPLSFAALLPPSHREISLR